jgi:SAM-dependent methyltransferase
LVSSRSQKETPTVAIEAMRIIAIGSDELVGSSEQAASENSVIASVVAAEIASSNNSLVGVDSTAEDETAVPPKVEALSDAVAPVASTTPSTVVTPEGHADVPTPQSEPDNEAAELEEVVEAESVPSVRRRPPPPRRSLPAAPPENAAQLVEPSTAEPKRVEVESVEREESGEPVESVESVETLEGQPIPAAPPQAREGSAPTPPSRVPREPPPRPKAKEASGAEEAPFAAATNESVVEKPKPKPTRRPWWEELFGEDFSRALARLTEQQIEQEATFIEESLGMAPGAVVLDLGCGAGEHAVELASRGYGVVGYDLSLCQLALAQETAQARQQKLNFIQGDMREMAFEEVFDGIYCWNTTFGYFEEEKNTNVVERMFHALKPGGTLLIDVINRDFAAGDQPSSVWYEGDSCVCMDDMTIDFLTSRMRVKRSLILDDGRTRECTYSIRLYSLHELGKILHDAGFRVTEASGHPTTPGVFLGQTSPRIIILAQKP